MKYLRFSLLAGLILSMTWSCQEDELDPVVTLGDAPSITAPAGGTEFVLLEAEQADALPAFTWTAADFGFAAGTTYGLQIDVVGNDFSAPLLLGSTNGLSLSDITQADLNNVMLTKGLPGEAPTAMEIRVIAYVSRDVDTLVSAPVAITVVPYTSTIVYPQLQVPGSHQGWDPSNPNTIIFSVGVNDQYEGYIYFADPNTEYKFTQGASWDVNWGDDGADGTLDPGGANILAATAGMYRLNVNLASLTHTQTRTDWGLIGSATPNGWDSDQDMTYDPLTGNFTITLNLNVGEIKFRANDDWAINLGDNDANKSLEYDGANIQITEAGNYTIDLTLTGLAVYTYTVTKN